MNTSELEKFDLSAPGMTYPGFVLPVATSPERLEQMRAAHPFTCREAGTSIPDADYFPFSAVVSNQRIDSYFTRMSRSSLDNYAADAKEGVAFLTGHRHDRLPVGYSTNGRLEENGEPAENYPRVICDFYTVRGLNIDGVDTDMFIRGLEAGLVRDVSIGFKEGEGFAYTCSVCGLDMWSWDCEHIPGVQYPVSADNGSDPASGEESRMVTAVAWIENARLSEVSAVYDGATPGAMVVKATRELRAGRLKPDVLRMLESAYRIHLPETPKQFRGIETNKSEDDMTIKKDDGTSGAPDRLDAVEASVRATALARSIPGVTKESTVEEIFEAMRTELDRVAPFEAKAAEGKKLREALVADAIAEGIRAFGDEFDAEKKTRMLEALDVDSVTELRSTWKGIADKLFGNTKRRSADDPEAPEGEEGDGEEEAEVTEDTVPVDTVGGV